MFEWFYWSSIASYIERMPKEAIYCAAGVYLITDIHKRQTQVKLEETKAKVRTAELEVEALKLKLKLQENQAES